MQTFFDNIKTLCTYAVDTVLPPRCVITGDPVTKQGQLAPHAWSVLDFIADPICNLCGIPFEFDVKEKTQCASCIESPPPYETARASLVYNDHSRPLILGFKHADKTHAVKSFTPWLLRAGNSLLENADYLIPVPLHPFRLVSRRYNQAALIAQELSKTTQIQTLLNVLERSRSTQSQGHLKYKQRHDNVKHAFSVSTKRKKLLSGKTVVLIDDVYTTGATVKECTKILLKNNVSTVHVLTLARVVKPGFD